MTDVGGDIIGRIYEYFLNKFAKNIASDDGVFFTPKSLVKLIIGVLKPQTGVLLDKRIAYLIQAYEKVQSPKAIDTWTFVDCTFSTNAA